MAVKGHRYRFSSQWDLDSSPERVYAALVDVQAYPSWWTQVRHARQLDETSGELTCRSLLPYDLTFVIRRELADPISRTLRASMTGDLAGTSQWTIQTCDNGVVATFEEDVVVRKSLVRAAGIVARPALIVNHALMMRSGEHGLRRHLAAVGA